MTPSTVPHIHISQKHLPRLTRMALPGTIRTLEPRPLTQSHQTLLRQHMPAGNHHRGIRIRGLLLADGTDENAVELIAGGKRDLDGHFAAGRPGGFLGRDDRLQFCQCGESDRTGRRGEMEGGGGAETEQRGEGGSEGGGDLGPRG